MTNSINLRVIARERVCEIIYLILSCPPAGPTTADESLFSMVLPGGNFVFTFVLGAPEGRVSKDGSRHGRASGHPSRRPPIEIGCCRFRHFRLPKSGRPDFGGRPPQDEGLHFFTRSFAGHDSLCFAYSRTNPSPLIFPRPIAEEGATQTSSATPHRSRGRHNPARCAHRPQRLRRSPPPQPHVRARSPAPRA